MALTKCPKCGHEYELTVHPQSTPNIGLPLYGTKEYYEKIYPNEKVPDGPGLIIGDMCAIVTRCTKCSKLFWTAEFGADTCGACYHKEWRT